MIERAHPSCEGSRPPWFWVHSELSKRAARGLLRQPVVLPRPGGIVYEQGRRFVNFSSNDYLDLTGHERLKAAAHKALQRFGTGAGGSRLMSGSLPLHSELEERLAALKGYPAALLFGSGFLANVGVIPALVGRHDRICADRLVHASCLEGARLSGARLVRYRHNDVGHLEEILRGEGPWRRTLIVTESLFSMDGDTAPLREIASVAGRCGAMLLVDEAHATGVFGPGGCGCVPEAGVGQDVTVCMGTLSKALGGYGAFVACPPELRRYFTNTARSFIYSTAPPPASVAAGLAALTLLAEEPDRPQRLREKAAYFRRSLRERGVPVQVSESPIAPVVVGENEAACALSDELRSEGIIARCVRPPTVPPGTSRLRLSVTLAHTEEDLLRAAERIASLWRKYTKK